MRDLLRLQNVLISTKIIEFYNLTEDSKSAKFDNEYDTIENKTKWSIKVTGLKSAFFDTHMEF